MGQIMEHWKEDEIYRIDHFLGEEMVNSFFEPHGQDDKVLKFHPSHLTVAYPTDCEYPFPSFW